MPAVQQLLVPARPRVPAAAPVALPRRQGGDVDGRAHPRNTRRELPTSKNPLLNNTETEPVGSKNPKVPGEQHRSALHQQNLRH